MCECVGYCGGAVVDGGGVVRTARAAGGGGGVAGLAAGAGVHGEGGGVVRRSVSACEALLFLFFLGPADCGWLVFGCLGGCGVG